MTELDVSKLTDQELVALKKRMERAEERVALVRENLDAAMVHLEAAIEKVENAAKLLPLDDPSTGEGCSNEGWRISGQLSEVIGAVRTLKYNS